MSISKFINDFFSWLLHLFVKPLFTIESYLNSVEKYTEKTIISELEKGSEYTGGKCIVSKESEVMKFDVEMYFSSRDGQYYKKEAHKTEPYSIFDSANLQNFPNEKTFDIQKPEGN